MKIQSIESNSQYVAYNPPTVSRLDVKTEKGFAVTDAPPGANISDITEDDYGWL